MVDTVTPVFRTPALYPSGVLDSVAALAHVVSRQDLVRTDQAGNVSEKATLIVDGKIFEDWETVWIQWSWGSDFSLFRFTCAEREPYPLPGMVLQFAPGSMVEIYLGGIQVINGVIIQRQVAYDAEQHMVQLQGVSASWFAARSSIEHKSGDFDGQNFLQIADTILAPTGVGFEIIGALDMTPFKYMASPSPSESIGQFLESLARERKIIVSNLPNGKFLFIGEHDWPVLGELVEGVNIKKCQCVISVEAARSEFIARAQKKANDESYGREASEQEARMKGILSPYSILITNLEHPVWTPAEVAKRAETDKMWNEDATYIDATITVYGWFRPLPSPLLTDPTVQNIAHQKIGNILGGHTLWQAGDDVVVHSPMAMLYHQPLKIRTVTWMQDNTNGTQTILNLTLPSGLNGPPIPKAKPNTDPPATPPPAETAPTDTTPPPMWPTPPPPPPEPPTVEFPWLNP